MEIKNKTYTSINITDIGCEMYTNCTFINCAIAYDIIDNMIDQCVFHNCIFQGKLSSTTFYNTTMTCCVFERNVHHIKYYACHLHNNRYMRNLKNVYFFTTNIIGCIFNPKIHIIDSTFQYSNVVNCDFTKVKFTTVDLVDNNYLSEIKGIIIISNVGPHELIIGIDYTCVGWETYSNDELLSNWEYLYTNCPTQCRNMYYDLISTGIKHLHKHEILFRRFTND